MESRTRILISVISSLAVSLVIALTAFSILKGMNTELRQGPLYDDIIEKTQALNILTASFSQVSGQSDVSQVKGILRSLDNRLNKITSQVPGEEVLVRHLQRNNRELGSLIDQLLFSGREMTDDLERERRNILISQVWMKVRFIADDTNRLRNMSQARVIAAQEKAGAVVIALIIILALTNGGIYFLSGRSIMRTQKALRESEERLRFALDTCHIGAWDIDLVDHTAYRSLEHDRIFGYTELLPEWTLDMFLQHALPEYRAEVEAMVREATSAQTGWTYECRIRRADGEIRWIWFSGRHSTDISGRSRVAGVVQDITERKRAEEALHDSERLYRAIGESIDYGIWTCAPDGRCTYASESFLKMVGMTQEQCSNFGWGDILHPDDAENTVAAWKECVRTEGVWDIEHRFRGTDGQWHPILARGVPVRNDRGELICWAGINLDISRMKRTEDELRASEEKFSTMLQTVPIAIALATLPDGALYDVNPAWLDLTEITRKEDAIGKTSLELGLIADAAQRQSILNEFRQNGFVRNVEQTFCTAKGVQRIVLVNLDKVKIGGCGFILSTMEEITERKRAEAALQRANENLELRVRERTEELRASLDTLSAEMAERQRTEKLLRRSEERYRKVVETQTETICRITADGVFTFINDAFCRDFGKTREELLGHKWQPYVFPDDVQHIKAQLATLSPSNPVVVVENRFYNGLGEIRWGQFVNSGLFDDEGRINEIQAVGRDITERKLVEEELQAANSTMSRLVRTVAHEFRTPLGLLTGSTDILDLYWDRLTPEKRLEQNEHIRNAARQISNLVNSVTSFQLSGTDRQTNPPLLQDMEDLCRSIAEEVETVWGAGHEFVVSIAADCGTAVLDDILFRRVLQNLLTNAFRYTPSTGTVSLHVCREKGLLLLEITDTGIGIPKEEQEFIFDAFYRSRNVEGRRGLGLGLSIVREALSQMGGTIKVTSSTGDGTTMRVEIPVVDSA